MKKSKFTNEQIVTILRKSEADTTNSELHRSIQNALPNMQEEHIKNGAVAPINLHAKKGNKSFASAFHFKGISI